MHKLRVLFVAGLSPVAGGGHGGQLAEMSTVYASALQDAVCLVPLSSTMVSVPPPHVGIRALAAARRLVVFLRLLRKVDTAFIYAGDGLSLIEKGLMCFVARLFGRGVVVRFGSGSLPAQVKKHWWYERWLRAVLGTADVVATQGPAWSVFFGSYPEAKGKIVEVGNAVAFGKFPEQKSRTGRRIVFAGWMHREKGIFEALTAFRRVLAEITDAHFTLAGGGRDLEEFKSEVRSFGLEKEVETTGWIDHGDVQQLYAEADILLFPSHYEGLPNAVLEAMGAALACVTTRVGSIPDVISNGKSGILVDVGDVDAMVSALLRLLRDADFREEIGRTARETVLRRFDVDIIWPIYKDVFLRAAMAAGRKRALLLAGSRNPGKVPCDEEDGESSPRAGSRSCDGL